MALSRLVAQTLTQLRTKTRQEAGDPSVDRSGNTIAQVALRYSDSEVNDSINAMLVQLATHLSGVHPGEALTYSVPDLTYPGGTDFTPLPSGVAAENIYRVEDTTLANSPREIVYVSPLEMTNNSMTDSWFRRLRYTLVATAGVTTPYHQIGVRPMPQASLTIRIYYVQPGIVLGSDSDASPLSTRWWEVTWLGAALKLMRRDGEATDQQQQQFDKLWQQFQDFSQQRQGPDRIRRRRRGYS